MPFGGGSGGSASPILLAKVTLTSAQIKAIDQTPIVVVPAPGAGKVVVPISSSLAYTFGTIPYSNAALAVCQGSNAHIAANLNSIQGGAGVIYVTPFSTYTALANTALVLTTSLSPASFNSGPIVTATIASGGTGYAVNDTGTIDPSGIYSNADATYKVTGIGGGGAVTTFTVTAAGTGYIVTGPSTGNNPMATATGGAQPGIGTGLTINVTAVTAGNGTLVFQLGYYIGATS